MKKLIHFTLLILLLLFLIQSASAIPSNITAESGSSYIQWNWENSDNNVTSIYIDGAFKSNTTFNSTILSDLNPREKHTITLVNGSNSSEIWLQDTQRTFYPPVLFYILFSFLCVFLILTFTMREEIKTFIFGGLTFLFGMLCYYFSYPFYFTIFSYLCLCMIVLVVLWLIVVTVLLFGKRETEEEI